VPVNICSSVYLTPVYVLPPSSRQKKDRKILGYLKGITRSINLSSGYLRVRTVCPSHTPKHKTPYTFIYFQLSVMFGESFRLVVACCCSFFVVAGSVPLRVKKLRLCFAVGVGRLFGQLTSEATPHFFPPPPDVRVHAAAPMLGYTRLPRFRVRHSKPRLFRVAFGGGGRVVGLGT